MVEHSGYPKTRLFVTHDLHAQANIACEREQAHYLRDVLRMREGDALALFNGREGEWLGEVGAISKHDATITCVSQLKEHAASPDAWLLFAPLKQSRHENVVVKATELGVSRLLPVRTKHTVADKINEERLNRLAVEAAEQCERMDVPEVAEIAPLATLLGAWPGERRLFYADESGAGAELHTLAADAKGKPFALLIGPEGGFARAELDTLRSLPFTSPLTLGPRILKADTAAIAALAVLQSQLGDWDKKPSFRSE